jgi:class 3 adenylate cyclase/tetratricopeptide (TPR) repeat protein
MICPHCQTENPAQARFCFNCGTPLAQRCANCQSDLGPGARFCSNCGQPVNVQTPADSARLARLAAAAPAHLADKIRSVPLTSERRIVTCLFADVVGSTSLAERMDADDWTEIMNRAFDQLSPAIYRYEGTIARLLGDALLAFFGAPVAHEDDPVRAVHAALELLALTRAYAQEVRQRYGIEFAIRVGLNTGHVVVGNVGSDLKYEYTAMGDAVNLAARMQSAARPMTVLISEHTYRHIAPVFDCLDLGPIEVKGKAEPVRVYEVQGPKAAPGRGRGLQAAGLESPLVGREAELARLLQTSAAVQAGLGRVVAIIGEAGLGKSRLIAEWRRGVQLNTPTNTIQWFEGRCLSYGQGLAYHLLIDLLRSLIGVPATANEPTTRAALEGITSELCGDKALEVLPYLGHLLSLKLGAAALERGQALDPQALQTRYLGAFRQLLAALAARGPLALILDDIHWADPSSVELLAKLLPLTAEKPLLFCLVTRADRDAPGWKLVSAARDLGNVLTEIALRPLSEADSRQLVTNLLEVEALSERVRATILRKAEGNPFFVEEVIRMLIERGAIARSGSGNNAGWTAASDIATLDIPDNVQGLLLARIDRLVDEAKRTLRVASVIGRQFSVRVLEQVITLAQHLSTLEASDLIRLAATQPELEYLFRHALIQEAAYSSLVKQDRRQLHLAVGEALERLYPERLASRELAPVLAQHFYLAGDDPRALKYLTLAGDAAARVYANAEAALHYSRALDIAKRSPLTSGPEFIHLYTSYGQALELSIRHTEALAYYAELEALAQARQDKSMEFAAVMARAKIYSTPHQWHDAALAKTLLERALALAHDLGDRAAESKILWNLMLLQVFAGGDLQQTVAYGERSLAIAREFNLREQMAFTLNDLAYAYALTHQVKEGLASLNEARALWRELGNLPMLSDNLGNTSIRLFDGGEYDQALAAAEESLRISQSIGNRWGQASSQLIVGQVYFDRGQPDDAIASMENAVRWGEPIGHSFALILRADLGWVYASLGAVQRGLELAQQAYERVAVERLPAARIGPISALARIYVLNRDLAAAQALVQEGRAIYDPASLLLFSHYTLALADGELALARQEYEGAVMRMDKMLTQLERAQTRPYIADALYLKSQALFALNRVAEARGALQTARARAEALGSRRNLWPILLAWSEIEAGQGDREKARALRQEAGAIIRYIAEHIHEPELRASFLNLPHVRAVLA